MSNQDHLDVVPVSTMGTDQVAEYLGDHSLNAAGVDAERIVYRTIDYRGPALRLRRLPHHRPDPRVMITGHSQGGHATMATGKALQHDRQFDRS